MDTRCLRKLMMSICFIFTGIGILLIFVVGGNMMSCKASPGGRQSEKIALPGSHDDSQTSIEQALQQRRSVRTYLNKPLTLTEVSQLLWAAQGINRGREFRTAPSAGALYPLEVYLVAGNVDGLAEGVYKYRPHQHELLKIIHDDKRRELAAAALGQRYVQDGAAVIVIAAVYERTTQKYGQRGIRYVHIEVGHAAQNIYLQAVSLNIGTVFVGAFDDDEVKRVLNLPDEEHPLSIMPVGKIESYE